MHWVIIQQFAKTHFVKQQRYTEVLLITCIYADTFSAKILNYNELKKQKNVDNHKIG